MGPSEGHTPPGGAPDGGTNRGLHEAAQQSSRSAENGPRFSRQDHEPEAPPASVWDEVDRAAEIAEQMAASGQELHFAHDPASGRMTILVRDLHSTFLRTLSPSEALELACGPDIPPDPSRR